MDIDLLFNLFINSYLRIFYISFPIRKRIENSNNNSWITAGIKVSCSFKKIFIYLLGTVMRLM